MEKTIIEHDLRDIEWVEDGESFSLPEMTEKQLESFEKSCDWFYTNVFGEDRLHYFIVIDDDNVEIIPASKYNTVPA